MLLLCLISTEQAGLGVIGRLAIICLSSDETVWKNIQMKILKKIAIIADEPRTVCVHETLGQFNPSLARHRLHKSIFRIGKCLNFINHHNHIFIVIIIRMTISMRLVAVGGGQAKPNCGSRFPGTINSHW